MQHCGGCGLTKPLSAYHRDASKPRGVVSTCKGCAKNRARRWYSDNLERGKTSRASWYEANRERRLAQMKQTRLENFDRYAEVNRAWKCQNKERKHETDRAWQANNVDKVRIYRRVSEARRRSSEGFYTTEDVERIRKLQKGRCGICRKKLPSNFEVDHIVPLSRGGSNWPQNIQLLCEPCNIRKHARDPIDHMRSLGRLL